MVSLRANTLKRRLREDRALLGMFCGLADPIAAEIVATTGPDWLMIDSEHAPNDIHTILTQLQALAAHPVDVVVRPPTGDRVILKRLLDIGVRNVLIPMVEDAPQAAEVVEAVRYPPAGVRGVGPSLARAAGWGQIDGYLMDADSEIGVICQIETTTGLEQLEAIGAVDGVDALFFGPSDLAASMGHLGDPQHHEVVDAIEMAIAHCRDHDIPVGVYATTVDLAQRWRTAGAKLLAVGLDIAELRRGSEALIRRFRSEIEGI